MHSQLVADIRDHPGNVPVGFGLLRCRPSSGGCQLANFDPMLPIFVDFSDGVADEEAAQ